MTVIYIDAGHGGTDPGAVAYGLQEKNITLQIALEIRDIMNAEYTGHKIVMSRTNDATMSLKQRTDKANRAKADYLLSIHINGGGGTGYEDYTHSGAIQKTTASLRKTMHTEIVKGLPEFRNRGMKRLNLHMLRESHMPSMLTESGFIDNKADVFLLKSRSFRTQIARAHVNGLAKAFNLQKRIVSTPKPPTPKPGALYKVQVGAYSNKKNADAIAEKLIKDGYAAFIFRE